MKPPLRVLIVEDSENDTRLLLRDLKRGDLQVVHQRVETAEALNAALDQQSWDFLLCDFTLPDFSGQKALEIVRKRDLDLPFIFVSGTLGEDVAVQAMRAGARDYVMKNNLTRLVPAMKRELGEANVRQQHRKAEEEMRNSEYKYRHLFESLGDAAFLIDAETGRILDANSRAEALLGRTNAEILSMREDQLYGPKNSPTLWPLETRDQPFEATVIGRDGKIIPVRVSLSKFELHHRKVLSALFHDLTYSQQSEKKIQEQANLLELAHDAIFVRGLDEKIQYWNKGAEQLYGWTAEEASNGDFGKMADEERASFEAAKNILLEEGRWSGEVGQRTKARQEVIVASSWTLVRDEAGNPTSILVIDTDITEKRKLAVQFLRAQRLEFIGTLAASIAHDLNNILQVIITNLDLASSAPAFNERLPRYLEDAWQGANRAANLARRLLTFSKGGAPIKQSLDVAEMVTPAVLLALRGSKLKAIFSFPENLFPIVGDPIQLTQVIEHVVINACEAGPQEGKLWVRAQNVEANTPASSELPAGRYVRIQIEDRGAGIPESIRDRIFEVCFTTKSGGSGLGLATVKSIMQQHVGSVNIESVLGHGTIVSLMLPATARQPEAPLVLPLLPVMRIAGRILVIDDEEMILRVVSSMLKTLGYEYALAQDGLQGVKAYLQAKEEGHPFTAVLLDATISNALSGEEVLKCLLEKDPQARVILCTGYADSDLFRKAHQHGFKGVLAKPFNMAEFVLILNKVLSDAD